MKKSPHRVAVGMSGGVDSSVAAYLLREQGCEVIGLTMTAWAGAPAAGAPARAGCFGPDRDEAVEAEKQARAIGIEHCVVSVAAEFKESVLDYFRREYLAGRTPNPCVTCNRRVKFGALLDRAREQGIEFDFFATGHYARVEKDPAAGRMLLRKAAVEGKDQSYFLCGLSQDQLARTILPLGAMSKADVRKLARDLGWRGTAEKPESQDFMAGGYAALFREEEIRPGKITDTAGKTLGEHRGLIRYTIGQRKGIGVGGLEEPLYVVGMDICSNVLVVGPREDLLSKNLTVRDFNWISMPGPPRDPLRVEAKIRQQHRAAPATVTAEDTGRVKVAFDEPQTAITPGQIVAMYDGDVVVGGGTIEEDPVDMRRAKS